MCFLSSLKKKDNDGDAEKTQMFLFLRLYPKRIPIFLFIAKKQKKKEKEIHWERTREISPFPQFSCSSLYHRSINGWAGNSKTSSLRSVASSLFSIFFLCWIWVAGAMLFWGGGSGSGGMLWLIQFLVSEGFDCRPSDRFVSASTERWTVVTRSSLQLHRSL